MIMRYRHLHQSPAHVRRAFWSRSRSILLVLAALLHSTAALTQLPPIRVGIIGSGVGGATTAYFLRQFYNTSATQQPVALTLLEASPQVGGRVQSITVDGWHLEAGASIIHEGNMYLYNLSTSLRLAHSTAKKDNSRMSIWDHATRTFLFSTTQWSWLNALLMLWHYGWSVFSLSSRIETVADKWKQVYDLQAANRSFRTPADLLSALDLYDTTQSSLKSYLAPSVSSKLLRELVSAAERVNYNQPITLNALTGSVGLIPMIDDRLWAVEGGNVRLVQGAANSSAAEQLTSHRVTALKYDGTTSVYTVAGDGWEKQFDIVVVAVPLEHANIDMRLKDKLPERPYQTTVATFVTGTINATFFANSSSPSAMSATILTTGCDPPSGIAALLRLRHSTADDSDACPFSSLSAYYHNHTSGLTTYKMFSNTLPTDTLLHELFTYIAYNTSVEWQAYPRFTSREQFAPFVLPLEGQAEGEGVYYVSAFENAVSCMECMAVSAKNVALLVREEVERRRQGAGDGEASGGGSSGVPRADSHSTGTLHPEL